MKGYYVSYVFFVPGQPNPGFGNMDFFTNQPINRDTLNHALDIVKKNPGNENLKVVILSWQEYPKEEK